MDKIAETPHAHVAILPSPGMGHLIPLVELAKRLVHHHGLAVTFLVPTTGPPSPAMSAVLSALPAAIHHSFLPPVSLSDLPGDARIETVISVTVRRSLPSLRDALRGLSASTRLVSLVVDLFGTDTFDVAREFSVSPFVFFPSTAMALSLFLYLPELDGQVVGCEFRDMPNPVQIPGCVPVRGEDLLDPVQDRANEAYKWLLHHTKRYTLPDGIMVNSFPELEPGAVKSLQETRPGKPPVYPVGPLVNVDPDTSGDGSDQCLKWLDAQPHGSVLFVSFGSGGTLSSHQVNELANGLELSEQKFLWVVRTPNDKIANATFFSVNTNNSDRFDFLPQGFLERTKGQGLVVPSWAPQAQVLAHKSTGGFLTHCGWNSALESVANGVPLIVWPLYAEQKMNAIMLTEDIKVALRPKVGENRMVGREEVAKVVKGLMEGEQGKKLRNRMKELKESAAQVLSKDGSSTKALSQVVLKWKSTH